RVGQVFQLALVKLRRSGKVIGQTSCRLPGISPCARESGHEHDVSSEVFQGFLIVLRSKNGKSLTSSSGDGRRPYSHSSNASAYRTAFPVSGPYPLTRSSRKRSATLAFNVLQRACRSHALRAAIALAGGTLLTYSSLPFAPPS